MKSFNGLARLACLLVFPLFSQMALAQEGVDAPIYKVVPLMSPDQLLPKPGELGALAAQPRIIPQELIQKIKDVDTLYLANILCYGAGLALDYNVYAPQHLQLLKPIFEQAEKSEAFLLAQLPWVIQSTNRQQDVYHYRRTLKLFFQQNPGFGQKNLEQLQTLVPTLVAIAEIIYRKQTDSGHVLKVE